MSRVELLDRDRGNAAIGITAVVDHAMIDADRRLHAEVDLLPIEVAIGARDFGVGVIEEVLAELRDSVGQIRRPADERLELLRNARRMLFVAIRSERLV